MEPFASESIYTEALLDVVIRRGIGRDGRRVWSEADDPLVKISKRFFHVANAFTTWIHITIKKNRSSSCTGKTDKKYGQTFNLR